MPRRIVRRVVQEEKQRLARKKKVQQLAKRGCSVREIAGLLGCGSSTVARDLSHDCPTAVPQVSHDTQLNLFNGHDNHCPTAVPQVSHLEIVSGFDAFWLAYPRRIAKLKAKKAWDKAIKGGVPEQEIIAGAERYAKERDGQKPKFTAHPATWLNAGRWMDDPGANARHRKETFFDLMNDIHNGMYDDPSDPAPIGSDPRNRHHH